MPDRDGGANEQVDGPDGNGADCANVVIPLFIPGHAALSISPVKMHDAFDNSRGENLMSRVDGLFDLKSQIIKNRIGEHLDGLSRLKKRAVKIEDERSTGQDPVVSLSP